MYQWDVFVSYRREDTADWVQRIFVPQLKKWLAQEQPGARVFLDVDHGALPVGSPWPAELREAIRRSRCLLPILSARYRESEWCVAELTTMHARQLSTGRRLVYPIQFADGDYFPPEVKDLQYEEFDRHNWYSSPSQAAGRKSFIDAVKRVCAGLAEVARNAPPWDASWQAQTSPPAAPPAIDLPGFGP